MNSTQCNTTQWALFAEVRYFQLHDLHIPNSLSSRYTQALVLQEAEEIEQFRQEAAIVRKETERMVRTLTSVHTSGNHGGIHIHGQEIKTCGNPPFSKRKVF